MEVGVEVSKEVVAIAVVEQAHSKPYHDEVSRPSKMLSRCDKKRKKKELRVNRENI